MKVVDKKLGLERVYHLGARRRASLRRATPAPEESKAGATSCTEVIHPLQAQLLVDYFHDSERPMAATSLTRAGCRATSGATSSTRARFGEVKHVFRSDLWERPSAPAPRFILCRKLMLNLDHPRSIPITHEFSLLIRKKALKEPNFQYNNYQQKSYSNNQQGGYQQRQNTQQGNYQPRQNTPPGFNNNNNQSTQAQGSSSQAPASDTSTMAKTNKTDMEAKKATAAKREFELRGKPLEPAEPSQQGVERTSRQRVLDARKAAEKEKRAGKAVASSSRDEEEEEPAPPKKAKISKGKGIAVERDRSKTPTVEELHYHLAKCVSWVPTCFADPKMMEELGIEDDVRIMLQHMKMESFYSMAYPTYEELSSQFLATLEASFYEANHVRHGWGKIRFKVNGKNYVMGFKEIGAMMGLEDNEDQTLPRFKKLPTGVWRVISGNLHATGHDKNSAIRHPAVRYLHRILVHTLYPRKEAGTVNEEELRQLYRAVKDNVTPEQLEEFEETDKMKFPTTNIFERFGMVGLFVERLMYYKDWVWTTADSSPQLGIGGMITPLLIANGVHLGDDPKGPAFIDAPYLRIATYISGRYREKVVYTYFRKGKMAKLLLPNRELTNIERPGIIHFDIDESELFRLRGPIDPVTVPKRWRGGARGHVTAETSDAPQEGSATPLYGPPRYHFTQSSSVLPHGPLREAHEHIDKLQRWNKAQDRTIFKLKTKYKELKKTVKKQAEASAQFMKKVADLLVRGGVGGCSSEDFVTRDTSVPQPQPYDPVTNPSLDLGPPLTARQLLRLARNPQAHKSNSGNKSPSLASTDAETDNEEVLEFPLEILEVLGSIWDQKGSGKCCLGEQSTRAGYGSDVRHPLQKNRRLARRLAPSTSNISNGNSKT
ncbi:hypothetical protein IGI04_014776 [Brassica rapa subsp. trilocularis]|uniref:Arabidopsis retrotransposon Orf1 C-terminal domain-containing protein n=1 Tax=Brassica rapa subsp. trilocularis TaxID=1813537 RepID=A0ABQ7MRK7_BRACM|nr:hypothetical protein IGI04_014776 [Brassica rapa subsp. trilocularis]